MKPHLVFVHGFTLSGAVFDRIFLDVNYQERYFLVRYDMRGHGRSGKPDSMEGYCSQLYADDFAAVMHAFHLHKPTYVGWSLGGTPAADVVACLPENTLSGIVYIASFFSTHYIPLFIPPSTSEVVSVLVSSESTADALKDASIRFSDGFFDWASEFVSDSPSETHLRRIRRWNVQSSWLGFGAYQNTAHRYFVIKREQDTRPLFALGKKGFPVLVIHGTRDALVYVDKLIDEARNHFTSLTVALIENGGNHAPFHDNPNQVMSHIGAFAEEIQKL